MIKQNNILFIPKVMILIATMMLVSQSSFSQEGWYQLNSGTSNTLRSVFFTDSNTGYVVGYSGTILKTTNGGTDWNSLNAGINDDLNSVYFIGQTGFIVGGNNNSLILKTTNSGTNWENQSVPASNKSLGSVFMLDSMTIFASGRGVMKTTNGGINWNIQYVDSIIGVPAYFNSVFFADENTGYAGGNNLMHSGSAFIKTTNGGINWTGGLGGPRSIFFLNSDTGYGSVYCNGSYIMKTINGGENWIGQPLPGQNYCTFSIRFADEMTGYAVGSVGNGNGLLFKTDNGGTNWNLQVIPTTAVLSSIFLIDANTGYAVGNSGTILKTINGGTTAITTVSSTIPLEHKLDQNYPNPFNPITKIKFQIPRSGNSKLIVFDLRGRLVEKLVDQNLNPGIYEVSFDGNNLSSGVYYYKLIMEGYSEVKRMVLVK